MTGWDTGLSQDYNGDLGRWFADRLGAREQLRRDGMTPIEQAIEALEDACGNRCNAEYNPCQAREAIAALRAQPDMYNVWVEGVHIPDDVVKKAVFLYMTRNMEPRKATRDEKIVRPGVYEVKEPKQ